MKKLTSALLMVFLCVASIWSAGKKRIGISMPTTDIQHWNQDGQNIKKELEHKGYEVDLEYAQNRITLQIQQIDKMIDDKCAVLVVAAIDGAALGKVLEKAKIRRIPVLAYDRLIMESDAVVNYVSFDNYKSGQLQAKYVIEKMNLNSRTSDDPVYIEFFTGAPDDNNVNYLFGGAINTLQPYLDNGSLVCRSKQTTKKRCSTTDWSTGLASVRMTKLIGEQGYAPDGTRLDVVLCSNDALARGVVKSLLENGGYEIENLPLITGQDCDIESVNNIINKKQTMSILRDSRIIAKKTAEICDNLSKKKTPYANDTKTYDNGTGVIPAFLCEPKVVDADNYIEALIDSNYYTRTQLQFSFLLK